MFWVKNQNCSSKIKNVLKVRATHILTNKDQQEPVYESYLGMSLKLVVSIAYIWQEITWGHMSLLTLSSRPFSHPWSPILIPLPISTVIGVWHDHKNLNQHHPEESLLERIGKEAQSDHHHLGLWGTNLTLLSFIDMFETTTNLHVPSKS